MKPRDLVAGVAVIALLAVTPALAQQQGTTSGPAVGTTVAPNAAAEKQNTNQETGGVSPGGALGTGSPGATAKSGTQGGPPPEQAAESRRDWDRDRGWDRGRDEARCECRDRDWHPSYDERGNWERDRRDRWGDRHDWEHRRPREWGRSGRGWDDDPYRDRDREPRHWRRDWEPRGHWDSEERD